MNDPVNKIDFDGLGSEPGEFCARTISGKLNKGKCPDSTDCVLCCYDITGSPFLSSGVMGGCVFVCEKLIEREKKKRDCCM